MDPITQATIGAVASQCVFGRSLGRSAAVIGLLGGLMPDVDVFFSGLADPAFPGEFHRHFTHSLLFIPIGGALTALPFYLFSRFRKAWLPTLAAATLGVATHGLLDAMTSYGTHLWLPFSDSRSAWDVISIIDPIFTLTLLIGMCWAVMNRSHWPARAAMLLALGYLCLGWVQQQRGLEVQRTLAATRGHDVERGRVMPTLGNLLVWRSIYEADGMIHADALRIPPIGRPTVRPGASVPLLSVSSLPAHMHQDARFSRLLHRFDRFTDGWMAWSNEHEGVIGDMRYSLVTEGFAPLWGLQLFHPDDPLQMDAGWARLMDNRETSIAALWQDILNADQFGPVTLLSAE